MAAGPIVFNYTNWKGLFPELAGVSSAQAALYFNWATLYVRNDGRGPINDPNMLTMLLNLTTAHLAALFSQRTNDAPTTSGAEPPSPLVGRIASATQGSVTVNAEMPDQGASAAWWQQTSYGAAAWQALKPFRTFRYLGPTRRRVYNPPARYFGNIGGGGWGGI